MPRYSTNPITSLDQSWSYDPLQQLPFSGAAVQSFIKSYLGAVSKAAYFDSTNNTMYWFATEEDKTTFIADPTQTTLVLFSTTMSFASELFRIALTNNNNTTSINVATNEEHVILSIDFDVQKKAMTDTAWTSTGQGVYISVQVDKGAYGNYITIMNPTFYAAETTFEIDVRNDIIVGANRVKVNFVSENDSSVVASITYTIAMTEMFIEPLNNEWYVPIVETGDVANYKLGGFRIIGAVNKTLHLDIYSGENKLLTFTKSLGTTAYDRVPYYYTQDAGLDLSTLNTGVYLVSAYLTSGSLTSAPVNYNIIYVATGDESTTQLVAVNEAADVVYNYTTSTLFKYAIYNKGTLSGSPAVVVKEIAGTTPTTIVDTTIDNVTTSEEHSYEVALEWLTEETLNLYVQGEITFGNEQIVRANLDNSATFPPTYGYEFYLNAASRNNNSANKLKIVNAVNGTEYTPTWTRMVWIDRIDGWTTDDIDRQCLYLPAKSKVELPYSQYKILNGDGITVEMCYKVSNVADYDETVISIVDDLTSDGFQGIKIKPTNILVHSSADTSAANDLVRGTNVMDEEVIHFVLTIYPNFGGNNGRNLVTGYVNGCKNFQFDYVTGTLWNTNGNLIVGADKSDVSLYFVRVYRSVLSDAAVQANYINSLKSVSARTDLSVLLKSCMDASQTFIDFEQVKNNDYNYFVVEMLNGASLPSRANGWDKTQKGYSNLEMHFGQHPSWDWRIENVETAGQGTTSMNYYRWNLRWRIDKSNGDDKKVNAQYLESRTMQSGSYQYTWGSTTYTKTINFDGTGSGSGNHPALKRMTAKINFASSMQSHKIGATRAYTDLHNAVDLTNEAQTYAANNSLPKPTVSVYEYPAFGFQKIGNTYEFIGLFTIGPDKGDKPTFGFDINNDIKGGLISIEGTDHSRKMVMFNYPWNEDVQYLSSNECLNIIKGTGDYDNGWEVGNCHDLSTDKSTDQAAIDTILNTEFKPAYNIAYENSTLIIGIPLGTYGATAEATLSYINSNIATFQSQLDGDNRMTYANYQFWIEGEYDLYYYDIKDGIYKANQNLVTQNGSPTGSTVAEQNEWFKAQRRARFMANAEDYWDIQDTIFHYCFIVMIGAMDNFGKNTYPYKMATLANGGRWKWRQDDLDSILGIGNAGADNMPTWMEFEDSQNGSVYFGGSTSVFWNLIHECYYDDYVSTETSSLTGGIITMGKAIMEAMSSLAGGTNVYDGVMKFMTQRFWNNAQNYFPQSAYNADAAYKYETAWLANGQEVAPLTQSLGNHYSAEDYWTKKRMIYMMSLFKAGAFGSYADTSLGQIAFRPQSLQSLTVTPETELYPAFASGQGMVSTARTQAGQTHTFVGPFGTDGQTSHYIQATNLLKSLGDLKDLQLGAQYINPLQIQGKKLVVFKIGDEDAYTDTIITPAVYYTQEECDAYNTEHELVDGDDGYLTTNDIKTPAVYESNVTTNVPSVTFANTSCLEKIDARYAYSITGVMDLSNCPRLYEAYFEGTSLSSVVLKNGVKIEILHLPNSTTAISLRNLRLLDDEHFSMPTDKSNITQVQIEKCGIDAMQILYDIYNTDDNSLQYFNVATTEPHTADLSFLDSLVLIAQGLDKDGNPANEGAGYHGMSADGAVLPTANPTIDGTFIMSSGFYQQDMDVLALTNIEPYPLDVTKNIGLAPFYSALYIVYDPTKIYFRFFDSAVNQIVADWIGDGVGTTLAQITGTTSLPVDTFRGNTEIVNFDDFAQFTGLTTITAGSSASALGAFGGCTSLESITIPSNITTVGAYAFYGCSGLKNLNIPVSCSQNVFEYSGNGSGKLVIHGNVTGARSLYHNSYNTIIIYGTWTGGGNICLTRSPIESIRIKGSATSGGGGLLATNNSTLKFLELCSTWSNYLFYANYVPVSFIMHLGYNGIANASAQIGSTSAASSKVTNIYVGDGSSRTNDEAVLAIYNADTNWSAQSSKLATWYDYNGEYKWYYVTDNLTNCTNTNPDAWPHITRGEAYETTIKADVGYTLSSIKVEMYYARDGSPTPDEPTDITEYVYNPLTGEINIEFVYGNIIITATATANA